MRHSAACIAPWRREHAKHVLVPLLLSSLVARCAPDVGPVTMSAIVVHESGARPFAIGDNTSRRSYFPQTQATATALAMTLLRRGHDLDLGFAQINVASLAPNGLSIARAFDACSNVATGARILRADYARARRRFGPGQVALAHALSAYNSGGYFAGLGYARAVYATAARLRFARAGARAVARHRATTGRDSK